MATRELTATVFYEAGELTYNFPFDYLKKSFVKAKYIENIYDVSEIDITEELTYGIDYNIEEKQLILKDTTGAKKYIMIYRETSTTPIVDFSDSSILTASNLNVSDLQKYMIIDELADYLIIHGRISLTDEDVKNIKLVDELPDVSIAYEPDIYIVKGSREGYQKFNNKWNLIFAPKASSLEDYDTLIKRVETSKTGEANKISFANSDGKLPNNITGSPDKLLGKTIVAVVDIPEGTCLVYRSSANDGQGGFVLEKVSPTSVINDEEESISTTYSSQKIKESIEKLYPVGVIYTSTVNINPSELFGFGTWEAMPAGRVLLAQGESDWGTTYEAGSIGGEATHQLTVGEMPSHNHTASSNVTGEHSHGIYINGYNGNMAGAQNYGWGSDDHSIGLRRHYTETSGSHTHTISIGNTGSSQAHNNMEPYIAVYMWKRTA